MQMKTESMNRSVCFRQRFFTASCPVGLMDDFCGLELEMVWVAHWDPASVQENQLLQTVWGSRMLVFVLRLEGMLSVFIVVTESRPAACSWLSVSVSHSCPSFLLFIDVSTVNYSYIVISDRVLVCSSLLWDPNAYSILLNKWMFYLFFLLEARNFLLGTISPRFILMF